MTKFAFRFSVACVLITGATAAQASPITYAAPYVGGLGYIPTFGEVFTPPAGNTVLNSFSFYFQTSGTGPYAFSGYVYGWNGSAVTGSALFSANGVVSGDGYQTFSPNLGLTAGQSYIAMFSWASGWAEGLGCASTPNIDCPSNPSPNTQFHYTSTLTDAAWHSAANWNGLVNNTWRVAFRLELGDAQAPADPVVPEPATLTLVGVGLAAAVRRRLRRQGC
jgi:hypothetical protein